MSLKAKLYLNGECGIPVLLQVMYELYKVPKWRKLKGMIGILLLKFKKWK